ncbi:arabinosyltransferase C-terminal domain-containing protein [Arenivirga flava]|uniref:arabinosyltransferase C-terminal domain-containing protein n=1 Tax=Arenivirga flava TaxID=1930060 RepID=UPI0024E0F8A1|nr:arabinosyltransferase C-terminal domain-containing protein [Arenivirga flava]
MTDWEGWRTFDVPPPADPAVSFSIVISSTSAAQDDWVAVAGPSIAERSTLLDDVPAGAAVSSHWMTTFWFSCERPPAIADGIIEPPAAYTSVDAGGGDLNPWRVQRGGIIAGVQRLGDVMTTEDDMLGFGPDWGNVHLVDYPVAEEAYDVSVERVVTAGWRSAFPEPSQLIVVEREG